MDEYFSLEASVQRHFMLPGLYADVQKEGKTVIYSQPSVSGRLY